MASSSSSKRQIPATPSVISPSPDPDPSTSARDGYFEAGTSLATRRSQRLISRAKDVYASNSSSDSEGRARSRSRSAEDNKRRRLSGLSSKKPSLTRPVATPKAKRKLPVDTPNGSANNHLSPSSAVKDYWRGFSRSPSPLGLIPIHRHWRSFIHRHEIPRKALHVSIGFLTLGLYARGYQTSSIHPILLSLLVPISFTDVLRHNWPRFNTFYIRTLGAFMRESEAHDRYNGVIWYLFGAWAVMFACPKDVGVMSVLLLSWCDTAASTVGRQFGRYTPQIRRGKSVAGSLAAFVVGLGAAVVFWGWIAPRYQALGIADNTGSYAFAFRGTLCLPSQARALLGWSVQQSTVSGGWALGIMSLCAGVVASVSEAVDLWGWDDNVTIPMLCGAGIWGFLSVFGA